MRIIFSSDKRDIEVLFSSFKRFDFQVVNVVFLNQEVAARQHFKLCHLQNRKLISFTENFTEKSMF